MDRTEDEERNQIEFALAMTESLADLPLAHHRHGHYVCSSYQEKDRLPAELEITLCLDLGFRAVCRTAHYF